MWFLILAPGICLHGQNAPVTTAGNISSIESIAEVPVTVSGFTSIGSCGLMLLYDPEIAVATAVFPGPQAGGSLNANLTEPGTIIIGWYTWPGISLPDSSLLLTVLFSKVKNGTSPLTWFDDGYSCFYGNDSSSILNDIPTSDYYINGTVVFQSEAPVTLVKTVKGTPGSFVDIPILVSGFRDIGKVKLTMEFDPSVLSFHSWTNTSGFPELTAHLSDPGTLVTLGIVDSGETAVTLADSSILYTLHFEYSDGISPLSWQVVNGLCAYSGPPPSFPSLYDHPKSSYYLDGSITPAVGIAEPENDQLFLGCHPNPFSSRAKIQWIAPSCGVMTLEVFNITGERIATFVIPVNRPGIHWSELSGTEIGPGIYTVRAMLNTDDQIFVSAIKIICCD